MERVIAIFFSFVLLTASSLQASSVEETYQAALTQEKGEGNLEEAIRLYKQVIEAHEKGEGDEGLAARAQLRIGVCQEKLGLAQARQTYEAVRDKYPNQPQVEVEAEQRLESTRQREAVIEKPSHRTTSESYIHRQLQQAMERAKRQMELTERQMEAIQQQLTERTKRQMEWVKQQMEQAKQDTAADSTFIGDQMRRQLEAAQRQMEQAERQMEQQAKQAEQQMKQALQRQTRAPNSEQTGSTVENHPSARLPLRADTRDTGSLGGYQVLPRHRCRFGIHRRAGAPTVKSSPAADGTGRAADETDQSAN